jgi:hypothetical protein
MLALALENRTSMDQYPTKEQSRVDTIDVLSELENEPNCLDSHFRVRDRILIILS